METKRINVLRLRDLNEAIKKWIKIGYGDEHLRMDEIISKAAKEPAPRFYVTYENARRFVSLLERGKRLPIVNKNKVEMYKEIYRRWRARQKGGRNRYLVLADIILEPAPSFYLSEDRIMGCYYRSMRKK